MRGPGELLIRPGRRTGAPAGWRATARVALALALLAGCSTTRVVPVAAPGAAVDPAARRVQVTAAGVTLTLRSSAWDGSPRYLPDYVTPFHVHLANGTPTALAFDYHDLRLFDEARFQYTALPPADVERILRGVAGTDPRSPGPPGPALAAGSPGVASDAEPGVLIAWVPRRTVAPSWGPLWWDPWWGWPGPYYVPVPTHEVLTRALPVGMIQPGAQVEGFVYFPALRPTAQRLTLEFHHRLGDTPRLLSADFAVSRG